MQVKMINNLCIAISAGNEKYLPFKEFRQLSFTYFVAIDNRLHDNKNFLLVFRADTIFKSK